MPRQPLHWRPVRQFEGCRILRPRWPWGGFRRRSRGWRPRGPDRGWTSRSTALRNAARPLRRGAAANTTGLLAQSRVAAVAKAVLNAPAPTDESEQLSGPAPASDRSQRKKPRDRACGPRARVSTQCDRPEPRRASPSATQPRATEQDGAVATSCLRHGRCAAQLARLRNAGAALGSLRRLAFSREAAKLRQLELRRDERGRISADCRRRKQRNAAAQWRPRGSACRDGRFPGVVVKPAIGLAPEPTRFHVLHQ